MTLSSQARATAALPAPLLFALLSGCSVPDRVVTVGGDAGPDTSVEPTIDGSHADAPDGSPGTAGDGSTLCTPGAPCNPANRCHEGEVVCTGTTATCRDTQKTKANGSSCAQASVCSDATCTS